MIYYSYKTGNESELVLLVSIKVRKINRQDKMWVHGLIKKNIPYNTDCKHHLSSDVVTYRSGMAIQIRELKKRVRHKKSLT